MVFIGSLHQAPVKSQEPGTVETMQTQQHNKSLDAPDGLYQIVGNYKIQDILIGIFGGLTPKIATTGVVQSAVPAALGP